MKKTGNFDLQDFLPYVLAQAAEDSSLGFQVVYKERYGLLRTEWRVLFHLGRYGEMSASEICNRSRIHKTKVSRAVKGLEQHRFLSREASQSDRRQEILSLTRDGEVAYEYLCNAARQYDARLAGLFTPEENEVLRRCLKKLARM